MRTLSFICTSLFLLLASNATLAQTTEEYEAAQATLVSGKSYYITTEYEATTYYLTTNGYLTDDSNDAGIFVFQAVAGGSHVEYGWWVGTSYFSNPPGEGAAFRGLYLQAYAHVALFGLCFDADRGWVGEGAGGGIGVGYVMPLSKKGHWRLEFGLQAGYFRCKYDPYQYENPVDPSYSDHLYYYKWSLDPALFEKRQYRYNWLGPTRVGITLT